MSKLKIFTPKISRRLFQKKMGDNLCWCALSSLLDKACNAYIFKFQKFLKYIISEILQHYSVEIN